MRLSVIIPCYNDGRCLPEAVNSVLNTDRDDIEVIIVNDGSTDEYTISVINNFGQRGITVLSHQNKGLGFTRNRGIAEAKGKYILPLDADNRIKPDYISKSVDLLDTGLYDIVYGRPEFFGEDIAERKFNTKELGGTDLLFNNYIDACAVFRKSVWEALGGYDEQMPYQGNEDWDFWIRAYFKGFRFKFINEALFDYRINAGSMIAQVSIDKFRKNQEYIFLKNREHILEELQSAATYRKFYENDNRNYLRTTVKYFWKFLKSLVRK